MGFPLVLSIFFLFPSPHLHTHTHRFKASTVYSKSFDSTHTKMVHQLKLNSGHTIPAIGFGTWQSKPNEVGKAVEEALKAGYRHMDYAKVYQNQEEIREGMKRAGIPRNELFITSKLWNNCHQPDHVAGALDDTLAELGIDYLDLYLIHWPVSFPPKGDTTKDLFPSAPEKDGKKQVELDLQTSLVDTWKAMIKLIGPKCKAIGVSNFNAEMIDTLIKETGVTPAANQIERHPLLIQPELIKHHAEKGIHITAYSPLGNNNAGLKKLFEYPEVIKIADKLKVTPAQVLIAWGLKGGHSVIPKSVTPSRIASNFVEINLPEEDYNELSKLGEGDKKFRFNVPIDYSPVWDINVFGEKQEQKAANQVKIV